MNLKELASRPIEELKLMAAQYSLKPHHKSKPETIAKMILEHVTQPAHDPMKNIAEKPKAPVYHNTPDAVREACQPFFAKEGFITEFPDDGTWIFKFKGAEESGNLSIPLRVIRMKAESVARGKRILHMINIDGEKIMAAG